MTVQNFLVLGMGRSGISVAMLLTKQNKVVYAFDKDKALVKELKNAKLVPQTVINIKKLNEKALANIDCVIISPGFVLPKSLDKVIKRRGILVQSEVDFASMYCASPIFAVSGTNGKTTTATFLHQLLQSCGKEAMLLGNVGEPFSGRVLDISTKTKVVLELSSFQLEHCPNLQCDVVALLNIAPDHLDRYKDFEEYKGAKQKLFDCVKQKGHILVNFDDQNVCDMAKGRERVLYFSTKPLPINIDGFFIQDNKIFSQKNKVSKEICDLPKNLLGEHNCSNFLCAVAMAQLSHIDLARLRDSAKNVAVPPHRIQFVGEREGVQFFNDSKATNIHAVLASTSSFLEPVVLLLGGSDKGEDFCSLFESLGHNVKTVISFGAMGKKICKAAKKCGFYDIFLTKNLEQAFSYATKIAQSGQVVLLSPGCASFDEFVNFEERGEAFCDLVAEWIK